MSLLVSLYGCILYLRLVECCREVELQKYFEAARMQNLLIDERKLELKDEGKTDPAEQVNDAELQRLEEVCHLLYFGFLPSANRVLV